MIYLDHAATTPLRPEVLEGMLPYLRQGYGNPSAMYAAGREAKRAVTAAREIIAQSLSLHPDEIYFTSGGTESDNWALVGAFELAKAEGGGTRIVASAVEHHAVLETLRYLEEVRGASVCLLPVDGDGVVHPRVLSEALREDCCLVSIMTANNEVGSLQPIAALADIAHRRNVLFHTDAVQAYGHMPMGDIAASVDLLSGSGHKLGGPKGIGFLVIRRGVPMRAFFHGGAQEKRRRAGTENVAGIVGLGIAAAIAKRDLEAETEREARLRDQLYHQLQEAIPHVMLNGSRDQRLANNLNLCFPGVSAETLLILLDQRGIAAGAGAACASGALEPSHVLRAMGRSVEEARSSVRLTVGPDNTEEEMKDAAEQIAEVVRHLRKGVTDRISAEKEAT